MFVNVVREATHHLSTCQELRVLTICHSFCDVCVFGGFVKCSWFGRVWFADKNREVVLKM